VFYKKHHRLARMLSLFAALRVVPAPVRRRRRGHAWHRRITGSGGSSGRWSWSWSGAGSHNLLHAGLLLLHGGLLQLVAAELPHRARSA
jgi:hypothetical protein